MTVERIERAERRAAARTKTLRRSREKPRVFLPGNSRASFHPAGQLADYKSHKAACKLEIEFMK